MNILSLIYLFIFSPIKTSRLIFDGLDTRYSEFNETSLEVVNNLYQKKRLLDYLEKNRNIAAVETLRKLHTANNYRYDILLNLREQFEEFELR
jgi:hypothetical protein